MSTTTNLADFAYREIKMARDLLDAWVNNGLPEDFEQNGVTVMMNMNSGNVFLTNDEFQVAMLNGDELESFYTSPYEGREGFFDDLLDEYEDMHKEDKEWFRDIAENRGDLDKLIRQFEYFINKDERGEFNADVRDPDGKTVFEIEGSEVFDDGFMSDKEDLDGLKDHLVDLGILKEDDELTKGN